MKTTLFTLFLFCGTIIQAQELELIGSDGSEGSSSTVHVTYSIGEVVIETGSSSSATLTQGYQQSNLTVTGLGDIPDAISVAVFPNPTADLVNIRLEDANDVAGIELYDAGGKIVWSAEPLSANIQFNATHLAAGTYHLVLKASQSEQLYTYQIIKTH